MNIGICIIAYNRIDSLKRLLSSLERAEYDEPVTLIISIDKSDTTLVEDFAYKYIWDKGDIRVIVHPKNLGLRKHILTCGEYLNEFDALIVLEDDITVAPSFYYFAKQCVKNYHKDKNVAGISLYNFPLNYHNQLPFISLQSNSDVYFMQCAQSWGQIWMKEQWFSFKKWYLNNSQEFGELPNLPISICRWPKSSWLKYHTKYCIENNKYFIYPYVSLSTNNSDPGTHNNETSTLFQAPLLYGIKKIFNLNPTIKYDGFFENEIIHEILGLSKENLCIDFYGEKNNRLQKRFWLTRKHLSYKIIKSYGLILKPYELNIINNIVGDKIFLYDTLYKEKNKFKKNYFSFMEYMYLKNNKFLICWKKKIKYLLQQKNIC